MDANYAPTDCGYEAGPGFCIQGANQTLRLPLDQSQETRSIFEKRLIKRFN